MQTRSQFLALTAAALLWGFGALEAWAGSVLLPATLNQFVNADGSSNGNFTTVQQPNELDTFSGFSYSTAPVGSPPSAANITVSAFLPPHGRKRPQFSGGFRRVAGYDRCLRAQLHGDAPPGFLINDAGLSAAMGNNGGTGSVTIVELLNFPDNTSESMQISLPGAAPSASLQFAGVPSILVQDQIFLSGGSLGANVNFVNQGFSSVVPEPTSIIGLSIGSMAIAWWPSAGASSGAWLIVTSIHA